MPAILESPPLGIGIKAKRVRTVEIRRAGVSTPRNWNQGKATAPSPVAATLESPPLGIGIKAKPLDLAQMVSRGVSTPRNWNQGKATDPSSISYDLSLHP